MILHGKQPWLCLLESFTAEAGGAEDARRIMGGVRIPPRVLRISGLRGEGLEE